MIFIIAFFRASCELSYVCESKEKEKEEALGEETYEFDDQKAGEDKNEEKLQMKRKNYWNFHRVFEF